MVLVTEKILDLFPNARELSSSINLSHFVVVYQDQKKRMDDGDIMGKVWLGQVRLVRRRVSEFRPDYFVVYDD